jgi:hypothetical protein
MGRKDTRISILKKGIAEIGKSKGFTHKLWYKVSNEELWDWILDNRYDRMFTRVRVKSMRKTLPMMYREKIQSNRSSRK